MKSHDKKIGKIIEEITTFLISKGCNNFMINIIRRIDKDIIVFKISNIIEKAIYELKKGLEPNKNVQLEEYGWGLLGECNITNQLQIVSMCIDSCNFKTKNSTTIMTIIKNK